jgi:uncharacterized membrane-anchored protein
MQRIHVPVIDSRYWTGIALASIFGTNLGDFYAHESGLGLLGGLPVLVLLFAGAYLAERQDRHAHDAYYWVCIIIMRTGATNIADYMAGRRGLAIDRLTLSIGLGLLLVLLAWWSARNRARRIDASPKLLPDTDGRYWLAMLTAGVFGTVLGDYAQGLLGQGMAAAVLSVVLAVGLLLIYRRSFLPAAAAYWLVIGIARTTGTAIGDWLAESKLLNLGLPVSTILTGIAFAGVLVFWRSPRQVFRSAEP